MYSLINFFIGFVLGIMTIFYSLKWGARQLKYRGYFVKNNDGTITVDFPKLKKDYY